MSDDHQDEKNWKEVLTPEQYHVLREKGTEPAFTGAYWDMHEEGVYRCAACKTVLFMSDDKFDSKSGWPSFVKAADEGAVIFERDSSHGMNRVEVICAKCGGHLGHIFDDGPEDRGGKRYCINSCALDFEGK